MERLPPELLFLILSNLSIGDTVNVFSTCRYLRDIGVTFLQKYLSDTKEAKLVFDQKLSVVGAITSALNLNTSIEDGRPFSIRPIASEVSTQFMCYSNLICYLRSGYICIYNNDRETEEYTIKIQDVETLVESAEQIRQTVDEQDRLVVLEDFRYHKLMVALHHICCLVCIELGKDGLWEVIYTRQFLGDRRLSLQCRITMTGILYHEMPVIGANFEWFDLKSRETHTMRWEEEQQGHLIIVPSGSSAYISRESAEGYEFGVLRLANGTLEYQRIQEYLTPFFMYPDGKGGVTLHVLSQVDDQLVLTPHEGKPGFHYMSRAFFEIGENWMIPKLSYGGSPYQAERLWSKVFNKTGMAFLLDMGYYKGHRRVFSLFLANFDARCEFWTSLSRRQTRRFTVNV